MRKMTVLRWRNKRRNRRCMYCTRYKPNIGSFGVVLNTGKCTGKLFEVSGMSKACRCPIFDLNMEEE